MALLYNVLVFLQIVAALGLLVLVMSQATKSEGLTGTIGGKSESAFRGKPGFDEKIADYTKWTAVAFMVASLAAAILSKHVS